MPSLHVIYFFSQTGFRQVITAHLKEMTCWDRKSTFSSVSNGPACQSAVHVCSFPIISKIWYILFSFFAFKCAWALHEYLLQNQNSLYDRKISQTKIPRFRIVSYSIQKPYQWFSRYILLHKFCVTPLRNCPFHRKRWTKVFTRCIV